MTNLEPAYVRTASNNEKQRKYTMFPSSDNRHNFHFSDEISYITLLVIKKKEKKLLYLFGTGKLYLVGDLSDVVYRIMNYSITGWNDKIVALEKTTWFHFHLMKTGFLFFFFFFVADHLLVGQLCANSKSDRSLLSCLKGTQCSTSDIGDAPLYKLCSLPIQLMTTGPLPAPSKCKSGLPPIIRTCPGWWKQGFRLRLWSLVLFQAKATSCHLTSSRSARKYRDVLKGVVIPWCSQVAGGTPWVWQQDSAPTHKSKETQTWLQKEFYDFVPFSH